MAPVSVEGWLRKFNSRATAERYGAYERQELPRLQAREIGDLASRSGIHPDILGPCRRAAARLNWVLMFRPIKVAAMHHVGEFTKLPKPMEIKAKADFETGLVKLTNQADFEQALTDGRIDPEYARRNGLTLDRENFLINAKGQKFFSDMDLYEVLNGTSGRQVHLGAGESATQGLGNRRELDTLINLLRPMGTDFALIQHGPERQWIKHDHTKPNSEPVTAFCPDGTVLVLAPHEVDDFIRQVGANC